MNLNERLFYKSREGKDWGKVWLLDRYRGECRIFQYLLSVSGNKRETVSKKAFASLLSSSLFEFVGFEMVVERGLSFLQRTLLARKLGST